VEKESWEGSVLDFAFTYSGQKIEGRMTVAEDNVTVEGPLSFLLVAFKGRIEETIKQELPEGFQRSEFQLEHGMVDLVVDRRDLKETVAVILRHQLAGWTE